MELNETVVRDSVTDMSSRGQVSWGAVWAGWAVAAGVAWLFYQLGAAIGLTVVDPAQDPTALNKGFSYGAGFWILLTWMVSLFVGGWYAGRMGSRPTQATGSLHGLAVWGLTAVISIVVGVVGVSGAVKGAGALIGGGASLGASAVGGAAGDMNAQASTGLEAEIKQTIGQALAGNGGNVPPQEINRALNQLDARALTGISGRLLRGDTEGAKNMIAINTTLNRQQVDSVINGLSAQVPRYKAQLEQQAQAATRYTAALMWVMFISTLLALGLAMWGGAVGGRAMRAQLVRQNVGSGY